MNGREKLLSMLLIEPVHNMIRQELQMYLPGSDCVLMGGNAVFNKGGITFFNVEGFYNLKLMYLKGS